MCHTRTETFEGPLPKPEALEQYNNIYPRAAEIIFTNLEKQINHRIKMEDKHLTSSLRCRTFGMVSAFIVVIGMLLVGFWLIAVNRLIEGWVTVVMIIGGVAKTYIDSLKVPDIKEKKAPQNENVENKK
ncbi:MAG: DUF2335 domain-containing protein [Caldisericia bacterium]|nr:DUF2335 domain-containing protein [Caldisericia bacterium]